MWLKSASSNREYAARNEIRISDFNKGNPEWCWDWYSSDYYEASKNTKNPHGPDYGDMRVYRGGQREYESVPVYEREMFFPEEYITAAGPYPYSFRVVRNAK